jgi:hypothetical protein
MLENLFKDFSGQFQRIIRLDYYMKALPSLCDLILLLLIESYADQLEVPLLHSNIKIPSMNLGRYQLDETSD